jgi:hypothetical protein
MHPIFAGGSWGFGDATAEVRGFMGKWDGQTISATLGNDFLGSGNFGDSNQFNL